MSETTNPLASLLGEQPNPTPASSAAASIAKEARELWRSAMGSVKALELGRILHTEAKLKAAMWGESESAQQVAIAAESLLRAQAARLPRTLEKMLDDLRGHLRMLDEEYRLTDRSVFDFNWAVEVFDVEVIEDGLGTNEYDRLANVCSYQEELMRDIKDDLPARATKIRDEAITGTINQGKALDALCRSQAEKIGWSVIAAELDADTAATVEDARWFLAGLRGEEPEDYPAEPVENQEPV